jgi:flagellar hook-associated protein 3 FlgL
MRISTQTIFAQTARAMNQQQASLLHVGQQIASGRRVLTPSDDPNAASLAVQVGQAQAITSQYTASRVSARNSLSMETSVLGSVTNAITSAKTLIVQAANGTLTDVDRASIASQLQGIYNTLIGQANATDGNGRYLFGGYQDGTPPFVVSAGQAQYVGDASVRSERIDASRLMPVADNGASVFQGSQGTAGFMAVANPANAGAVTLNGPPAIVDTSDPAFGAAFQIKFQGATYTIEDQAGTVLAPAQAYDPAGTTVSYGGLSVALSGAPAAGDAINVGPAKGLSAATAAGNGGSLALQGEPQAVDAADPHYGQSFQVQFAVSGGVTTYSIVNPNDPAAPTAQAYAPGDAISYGGVEVKLAGAPANGDSFKVTQSPGVNTDLFKTLEKALAVLNAPADTPQAAAMQQNTLGNVMSELDNSLNNVSMVQASVGSRLNELDVVDSVASNRQINYAQTKSDLVDLDYTTAISDYTLRQVGLQAAQKTFMSMTQMNLFSLL